MGISKSTIALIGMLALIALAGIFYRMQSRTPSVKSPQTAEGSYQNDMYGFRIEYPKKLAVHAVEHDIQSDTRAYNAQCESGAIGGCGGSQNPEYQIQFQDQDQKTQFSVNIYVSSLSSVFGGKENEGFTYQVMRGDFKTTAETPLSITDSDIEKIQNSMTFVQTRRSVKCLWTPEFVAIDVKNFSPEMLNGITQRTGYYFDKKLQACEPIAIYEGEVSSIPFHDLVACTNTCPR